MRGVNKLILDIKDTDNEFFDRAILFLKPDKTAADQSQLNENARKLLSAVKMEKVNKKRRLKILLIGGAAVLAAAGALTLVLLLI
mgnify:CR=1 FL=1